MTTTRHSPLRRLLLLSCLLAACGSGGSHGADASAGETANVCGYQIRTSCDGSTGSWTFACVADRFGPTYCRDVSSRTTFENGCRSDFRRLTDAPDCAQASLLIDALDDPCRAQTDCAGCTAQASCGWCNGLCYSGTADGPTGTTCNAGETWAWLATQCR